MNLLENKKILILVDDLYEDLELWYPKLRLSEEGAEVIVAASQKLDTYKGKNGYPCKSDVSFDELLESNYDGLIIPGGFAPDKLRRIPRVIDITKNIFERGKLIAPICHGGWVPISAKIVKGFKLCSSEGIKDDLINAGAEWFDEPFFVDRNFVSCRGPNDLPKFCKQVIHLLVNQP